MNTAARSNSWSNHPFLMDVTVIREEEEVLDFFYDSLKELALSAIVLGSKDETSVIFMDEPGEHKLILKKNGKNIIYELRWIKDWASWSLLSEDNY